MVRLAPTDIPNVVDVIQRFGLDYDDAYQDDAYQYVASEKHGITIVSFDADFDRTQLGANCLLTYCEHSSLIKSAKQWH